MARLPWTKFQDFYLRLGFLKALVAVLSPQRRSALNEQVVRRLIRPLFDETRSYPELAVRVESLMSCYPRTKARLKAIDSPEVAEALLVEGNLESFLYGITRETAYKILDWAKDVDFVGAGNQITERALLLRNLLPSNAIDQFFAGDPTAWNPFVLSNPERLLFLYHLVEIDRVTVELIYDLAALNSSAVLESSDAAKMTCHALFRVLDRARDAVEPRDLPTYRIARELACTIANELGLAEYGPECSGAARRRPPKPAKIGSIKGSLFEGGGLKKVRKTTKNADHQTIPRFEQLVDLGFLSKPEDPSIEPGLPQLAARKRWRYVPTDACRKWAKGGGYSDGSIPFQWNGFAHAAVNAFSPRGLDIHIVDRNVAATYLWQSYLRVGRQLGPTPADSVMLFAMISAASDGIPIEMTTFHRLLLDVKQKSILPEHAFFSAGNELDSMFLQLKPGFLDNLRNSRLLDDHP